MARVVLARMLTYIQIKSRSHMYLPSFNVKESLPKSLWPPCLTGQNNLLDALWAKEVGFPHADLEYSSEAEWVLEYLSLQHKLRSS